MKIMLNKIGLYNAQSPILVNGFQVIDNEDNTISLYPINGVNKQSKYYIMIDKSDISAVCDLLNKFIPE